MPSDSPESNYGAAFTLLLSRVAVPEGNIHRMRGELDPEDGAQQYETELGAILEPGQGFDLALLGMGPDGHTASLFPGTRALCEDSRRVVANYVPSLERWRLTATYPLLNASRAVIFLVAGPDKATMVSASVGAASGLCPPAAGVRPASGKVLWLLDEGAARLLAR